MKLGLNEFILRASALALREVPEANTEWENDSVKQHKTIDISVALQTPTGAVSPIVRNVDRKGLASISQDLKVSFSFFFIYKCKRT